MARIAPAIPLHSRHCNMARIAPAILLHSRHPWQSDGRGTSPRMDEVERSRMPEPRAKQAGIVPDNPLHSRHCNMDVQVPRTSPGMDEVGRSRMPEPSTWQGLFLTILLHSRHSWRSDVRERPSMAVRCAGAAKHMECARAAIHCGRVPEPKCSRGRRVRGVRAGHAGHPRPASGRG